MKNEKKTSKVRFKFRVAGVAMHQGRVLLHQFEGSEYWSLPGGNVEIGETSVAALTRELKEEADLDIDVKRLLWVHENYFVRASGKQVHEICFYYFIKLLKEQRTTFQGTEGEIPLYFRWTPLEEIEAMTLVPSFLKAGLHLLPATPEHVVTFTEKPEDRPLMF